MNFASILTYLCLLTLFYHFIGYPLLLWLWTKMRPTPLKKQSIEPKVSILIAAYNEETVIKQKLESCFALDYPQEQVEIIVICDGSTDATASIVSALINSGQSFATVRLIENGERRGKSYSLNRAAELACGEILLISDANALLEPSSVRKLVANFADTNVGCISGSRHLMAADGSIKTSAGLYWRYESAIKSWETQTGSTLGVLGSMLAIRRELFTPIPADIINDDFYIALCSLGQGKRVIYEPEAVCWAYASQSVSQEKIRRRRISAGRFQHLLRSFRKIEMSNYNWFKLISHKYLRLFLLPFMVVGFGANTVVLLSPPVGTMWIVLWGGQFAFYGLAVLGSYFASKQIRSPLPAIAYYVVSGAWASVEGILGYLTGSQTILWQKVNRGSL